MARPPWRECFPHLIAGNLLVVREAGNTVWTFEQGAKAVWPREQNSFGKLRKARNGRPAWYLHNPCAADDTKGGQTYEGKKILLKLQETGIHQATS